MQSGHNLPSVFFRQSSQSVNHSISERRLKEGEQFAVALITESYAGKSESESESIDRWITLIIIIDDSSGLNLTPTCHVGSPPFPIYSPDLSVV